MRKRLVYYIKEKRPKLSILVDESDTASKHATMIVYLRACFAGNKNRTVFFDLVEILDKSADGLERTLLNALFSRGITEEILDDCLVGFGADGASAMMGTDNGLAVKLKNHFSKLIVWHCSAHRLQLAVGDVVLAVAGIDHFRIFMDSLYALYHPSSKNQRELEACAKDLNEEVKKIGRILDVRWVASSERTCSAVWSSFPSLYRHFRESSKDDSRSAKERAKYLGLAERISSKEFVLNLGLLFDALTELAQLSTALQKNDIAIPSAHNSILRCIQVFQARKEKPGIYSVEAHEGVEKGCFKNVELHDGRKCNKIIDAAQFYQGLVDNMRTRLFTTVSTKLVKDKKIISERENEYKLLLEDFNILDPKTWKEENILYGEDNIRRLATRLQVPVVDALNGFREYLDNGGEEIPTRLQPLITASEAVPVTTAECERGYSCMNNVMTRERSSLAISRLANCMFLKINGPPIEKFNPAPYVLRWLAQGHHSALNSAKKKKKAEYNAESVEFWKLFD